MANLLDFAVGVVGAGRLNGLVTTTAAACGLRRFVVAEPQDVEADNLDALLYACGNDVGRPKVDVLADFLRARYPLIDVRGYAARVEDVPHAAWEDIDVLVAAPNSKSGRDAAVRLARNLDVPLINVGVANGAVAWIGAALVWRPGQGGACPACLLPFAEPVRSEVLPPPVLCCAAGLAVTALLRVLRGQRPGPNYWVMDVAAPQVSAVAMAARPDCRVCGGS